MRTLLYRHNHLLAMCLSMVLIMIVSLQILQDKFDPQPVIALRSDNVGSPAEAALHSSLVVSELASRQIISAARVLPRKD